jgi:DNA mismatch repair ATPase MutS
MYRDRDFDLQRDLPPNAQSLTQDLELNVLFNAMAQGDKVLLEVATKAVLGSMTDRGDVLYRQDILQDCLKNPSIVRDIYGLAVEAIENERKNFWGILSDYPDATLRRSIEVLQMFVTMLGRLRKCAEMHAGKFGSEGFATLFSMLQRELDDDYFACVKSHLQRLKFRGGVLISAQLGKGNKGTNYVLRKPEQRRENWFERLVEPREPSYTYHLHPRDESGAKALGDLNDRGVNLVANALAQSTDHIVSFFSMLRTELAFYVGCLNLHGKLANKGGAISFPVPACPEERRHSFSELYDPCLALTLEGKTVSNDVNADHKELLIITGANQGGKSTFLRGIGLSQLMMQCGMFVPARSFSANMCSGVFTHFKREEDSTMESGKFDEELNRMSDIADQIRPNAMLLFNESFAATNEREGSEIARQIVNALLDKRMKIFFVTHLYELAHGFYGKKLENAFFLRAERQADGARTFKLVEREPLSTSYGQDLYSKIFK